MYKKLLAQRMTAIIALIWIAIYLIGLFVDLLPPLEAKGISLIENEFFRFATGPLLHFSILHLAVNIWALLWVGYYLEPAIGSLRFALFAFISGTIAEFCYCAIFTTSEHNIGGSVWIFALFGLIIACALQKKNFPCFKFSTNYGSRLICYAILGNLPLLPFCTVGTVLTHLISFAVGFVLASIGIFCKLI